MRRRVPECLSAACLCALACEKPPIGPGLDQYACGGHLCPAPGVVQGSLVYSGTARGDAIGAYGEPAPGRLRGVEVGPGEVLRGVTVELTQTTPYDPPSFELVGGPQTLDPNRDRPARLKLRTTRLAARGATFENARFALELDRDSQGNRRGSFGEALDDLFPRVFLRQLSGVDGQGNSFPTAPGAAAIVPCRVNVLPVLPALLGLPPGAPPVARDTLEVLVQPWA